MRHLDGDTLTSDHHLSVCTPDRSPDDFWASALLGTFILLGFLGSGSQLHSDEDGLGQLSCNNCFFLQACPGLSPCTEPKWSSSPVLWTESAHVCELLQVGWCQVAGKAVNSLMCLSSCCFVTAGMSRVIRRSWNCYWFVEHSAFSVNMFSNKSYKCSLQKFVWWYGHEEPRRELWQAVVPGAALGPIRYTPLLRPHCGSSCVCPSWILNSHKLSLHSLCNSRRQAIFAQCLWKRN